MAKVYTSYKAARLAQRSHAKSVAMKKFAVTDIVQALTDLLPGGANRKQRREFEKQIDTELQRVYDIFDNWIKWWDTVADRFGAWSGDIDAMVSEFLPTIQELAPNVWSIPEWQEGLKAVMTEDLIPVFNKIRPVNMERGQKWFDTVKGYLVANRDQIGEMIGYDLAGEDDMAAAASVIKGLDKTRLIRLKHYLGTGS